MKTELAQERYRYRFIAYHCQGHLKQWPYQREKVELFIIVVEVIALSKLCVKSAAAQRKYNMRCMEEMFSIWSRSIRQVARKAPTKSADRRRIGKNFS